MRAIASLLRARPWQRAVLLIIVALMGLVAPIRAAAQEIPRDRAEIHGSMNPAMIRRAVHRSARATLRQCYRDRLLAHRSLGGRWLVQLVIAATGRVTLVRTVASDLDDPELERCAAAALSATGFPSTGGGITVVTWPFDFVQRPPARSGSIPRIPLDDRGPYVVFP